MHVATQPITTASTAPVWMFCPVSAWLAQLYKKPKSPQALEGEAAHEMAQLVLSGAVSNPLDLVDKESMNGVIFSNTMVEPVTIYANEVRSHGPDFWVEESVSVDFDTPVGTLSIPGRCDGANFSLVNGILRITDFKYGHRTVEVVKHWSLIIYAIAIAMRLVREGHTVNEIELIIVQPRAYHHEGSIRSWSFSGAELSLYRNELQFGIEAVYSDDRKCVTGNHCNNCDAQGDCPVAKMAAMNGVDIAHAPLPDTDTPDQVAALLDTLDRALDVIKHTRSAMVSRAETMISDGQVIPGRVMRPGKGHRQFIDENKTRKYAAIMGISIVDDKLCSPAEAVRRGLVTKGITHIPSTAPKLVKFSGATQADKAFKNE